MLLWILLAIAFVFLDRITKYLAVIFLRGSESFPLIKGVLHFTYVENEGAAFGMLKNHRWIFMVMTVVAMTALAVYFYFHHRESRLQNTAIVMIIAGGIGNMIDRVVLGYVVDFIDFTLIDFAVFNVADSFICIGVGLFALYAIMYTVKCSKESKTDAAAPQDRPDNSESGSQIPPSSADEPKTPEEPTNTEHKDG